MMMKNIHYEDVKEESDDEKESEINNVTSGWTFKFWNRVP